MNGWKAMYTHDEDGNSGTILGVEETRSGHHVVSTWGDNAGERVQAAIASDNPTEDAILQSDSVEIRHERGFNSHARRWGGTNRKRAGVCRRCEICGATNQAQQARSARESFESLARLIELATGVDVYKIKRGPKTEAEQGAWNLAAIIASSLVQDGAKQLDFVDARLKKSNVNRMVQAWGWAFPKMTRPERAVYDHAADEAWFESHLETNHPESFRRYQDRKRSGFVTKSNDVLLLFPVGLKAVYDSDLADYDPKPAYEFVLRGRTGRSDHPRSGPTSSTTVR